MSFLYFIWQNSMIQISYFAAYSENLKYMKEFEHSEDLKMALQAGSIEKVAIQSVDLCILEKDVLKADISGCIFLGCKMTDKIRDHLYRNNFIFPSLDVPYLMYPNCLYNKDSLYNNYDRNNPGTYDKTYDKIVYDHYLKTGKESDDIKETLARRLHDHGITDSLQEFIQQYDEKQLVAIMGGHALERGPGQYTQVAEISKILSEKGYLMLSGGGPGAMEATHLGAWFAFQPLEEMHKAIGVLSNAPLYKDKGWLPAAFEVIEKYPLPGRESLGIPTWLYGHEPPTPFATHIAKYFANSVREEGLLAIAKGGIIFAPGSAGTLQEIFQEITQNHYKSFGYASPMVFLDKFYWTKSRPVFPLIKLMSERGDLENLDLGLYDDTAEIVGHIERFNG